MAASWFETAIFYKLPVRSFFDASGDGLGDLRGLTQKLDYIADLGATCVWLLPFFPSPLRDDGYDVTDYRNVHSDLGTMDDFRALLAAAHERKLRVAAEMVINHTSDEHPWFTAACQAPAGSPLRDFYVWRTEPADFHRSRQVTGAPAHEHWTWQPTAKAFYWHRFSPHQPDLNYESPAVREELLKVLRFWADLGVDGLCLNGAAYLVEQAGVGDEHLPATHEVLKFLRGELLKDYPDLMIQAGVNAWPDQAARYFGDGSQCQLVPNLPLAPRMFLALRQESAQPIVNLLAQTPLPPAGCQWATLLRNHDELTLSLATDEEQDYLFREYARDPAMRRENGILRRLACLAGNDRRQIELLFSLLFALPGAPVIYYGDEIGMGDNVFLRSRRSIRTPMQWSSDHNGGFSTADFGQLYAPPVMDPVYGFAAVNVRAQQREPASLLHWMRRLIAVRQRNAVFALGSLEVLELDNPKVLAFVRHLPPQRAEDKEQTLLIVANLSSKAQPVSLPLERFAGLIPVEMLGRTSFPEIGERPYHLTLAAYSTFLFQLQEDAVPSLSQLAAVEVEAVAKTPSLPWVGSAEELFQGEAARTLETQVLPGYLKSQRWFGGKAREIRNLRIADVAPFAAEQLSGFHLLLEVLFATEQRDLYYLPVIVATGSEAVELFQEQRGAVIARLEGESQGVLLDAVASPRFCSALLEAFASPRASAGREGSVRIDPATDYERVRGSLANPLQPRLGPATSSNSLVFFGRRLLLKVFRRLELGINPDYEIGQFLTLGQRFKRSPPVGGKIEYQRRDQMAPFTLGILQALVANQGDGWAHALDELTRYYARAQARMFAPDPVQQDERPLLALAAADPPPAALETIAGYLNAARALGQRTAEMHRALASDPQQADFAPQQLTADDMQGLHREVRFQAEQALDALGRNVDRLPAEVAGEAQQFLDHCQPAVEELLHKWQGVPRATKTRVHGDYHLGQVLWVDGDYVILDFEGEPTRTVDERRKKFSPLRDVAGMLRSYHYAAYAGLFAFTHHRPDDLPRLSEWADIWQQWVGATFLREYLHVAAGASFLPSEERELSQLLEGYMLAKALYELVYELNNRPDWVRIPLGGISRLLRLQASAAALHQELAS